MIQLKWVRELNRVFPMDEIILTKEYLKELSSFLAIREMQTKTTLRFHLSLKSTKQLITLLLRLWGWGTLIHCCWECRLVYLLYKSVQRVLKTLKAN